MPPRYRASLRAAGVPVSQEYNNLGSEVRAGEDESGVPSGLLSSYRTLVPGSAKAEM